jgi:hypothetical protein
MFRDGAWPRGVTRVFDVDCGIAPAVNAGSRPDGSLPLPHRLACEMSMVIHARRLDFAGRSIFR